MPDLKTLLYHKDHIGKLLFDVSGFIYYFICYSAILASLRLADQTNVATPGAKYVTGQPNI